MDFRKKLPLITYPEFLERVKNETHFTSSHGKRYLVTALRDEVLHIERQDANRDIDWDIDLKQLYNAYSELEDFATENFRPYVPRRHSPSRGLLLRLGLIG
jgi:hypothetical protein